MSTPYDTYRVWLRKHPAVGCAFARYLAVAPERHGLRAEMLDGCSPAAIAADLATRIDRLIADTTVSAATLVFQPATTLEDLARVALELESHKSWSMSRSLLRETPVGDVVAFRLAREIPFQGALCPSEALVLGPYPEFPPTRCSPVTVLEIFVGEPPTLAPDGSPTTKANLASMSIVVPSANAFKSMWAASERGRSRSLNGANDLRAKARVTFVIPLGLARGLGCAP